MIVLFPSIFKNKLSLQTDSKTTVTAQPHLRARSHLNALPQSKYTNSVDPLALLSLYPWPCLVYMHLMQPLLLLQLLLLLLLLLLFSRYTCVLSTTTREKSKAYCRHAPFALRCALRCVLFSIKIK